MGSRGSNHRLFSASSFGNRMSFLMLSMFATMAWFYVADRLWQDAESRVYIVNELDKRTGQGKSSTSVDDTMKIITCRPAQMIHCLSGQKKLAALNVDLEKARQEGFVPKHLLENSVTTKKKLLAVVGIITMFGRKNNRDAIRKAWLPIGTALNKLEAEKGIVIRFVIGRSANQGDSSDREIDNENREASDFMILENHVETPEERAKKTKLFLIHAVEHWDAEFYGKINDDVKHKWYEPDWWNSGMVNRKYFRHASGEVFAISQPLAQFISVNRLVLRTYAHDDVSVGSWFIGLDVKHVDEVKFCCSSWASGAICASA